MPSESVPNVLKYAGFGLSDVNLWDVRESSTGALT